MKNFKLAKGFPEYRDIDFSDTSRFDCVSEIVIDTPITDPETQQLLSFIFAPDPVTGNPRSDLALLYSRSASPEIARFIQDTLARPLTPAPTADDADFVLDTVKTRTEAFEAYADRLRSIVSSYYKKDEKDE